MKIQLLIDSIVQQTTVLIARLATTGGALFAGNADELRDRIDSVIGEILADVE
jgi:hypothetical protein